MSSLNIINKAIDRASGTGLPFYAHKENIFSASNNYFNSSDGLLFFPIQQVPVFQLHLPFGNKTSFEYLETRGGNNFTGNTFVPPPSTPLLVKEATKGGAPIFIWQTPYDQFLATPAPVGRWVIKFVINNGLGTEVEYYSEEFLTVNCINPT